MIPGWKVKREVLRFRQQIAWYWELLLARHRTSQHDRDRPRLVQRHDGAQSQGRRVAALLIFQPGSMPASIPESCDLLTRLGYSVLIVSNGALQPQARADLLPHVWRVLERPNLGYDFGGYREAVMHLWDVGADPDEMLILNDSVWILGDAFPAFLDRLAGMKADVAGTVLRSKKGKRWIESFFFQLNRTALTSEAYRTFWQGYRLIDSKFGVIRQGERDFTDRLGKAGLRVATLGDNGEFVARLAQAPDEELRIALSYAAPVAGALGDERARLLAALPGPQWRAEVLHHIAAVLDGSRVWHSQFPVAGRRVMGLPFIKKSREPVHFAWRAAVLRAIGDGVFSAPSPDIMSELRHRQGQGESKLPHWVTPSVG